MAKAIQPQEPVDNFRDYLEATGNSEGLDFISGLESGGHKLTVRGAGYIGLFTFDCVYGYDVFANEENKRKYANLLETSSEIGSAAVTIGYSILSGSVHALVKADSESLARAYMKVINDEFERVYDDGAHSVGYPFRARFDLKKISGTHAIWNALGEIHGYSAMDGEAEPYNSLSYLMRGNTMANLVLGIELGISDISSFGNKLASKTVFKPYKAKTGYEKLNEVLEDMRKRYVYPYAKVKEDTLAMIMGETSARCGKPYATVAKKMHCYKGRHDLTVTTLCSFMIRRKYTFDQSTNMLQLGSENMNNLIIETLAELNRLTGYSYEYIVKKMLCIRDSGYGLLVTVFKHLHNAYGWSFAELCEKYHIARDAMYIRSLCNF